MRWIVAIIGSFLFLGIPCTSCVEYTPKPRGYVRIEPAKACYKSLDLESLPFNFDVSQATVIELPDQKTGVVGLNILYPELEAKLYCSYLPITPASLATAEAESRSFVARQIKSVNRVSEKAYANPSADVYGSLFLLDGESASPIQFLLTDSVSNFFRGALYFDCKPNADSLAPAIQYIREDIIELIQTFSWKE
ncbi:gliding motility protein GldD [uncultured Parabacteroides sp.]|uniref:gliding motility lipoprotein GldD n=1 Tax=uncultured Parabacteroides sp. TaxID=512312 RepID=UPI002610F1BD|nr:gliding motility protein GldD [uncultured Parabacteroides sp.]